MKIASEVILNIFLMVGIMQFLFTFGLSILSTLGIVCPSGDVVTFYTGKISFLIQTILVSIMTLSILICGVICIIDCCI